MCVDIVTFRSLLKIIKKNKKNKKKKKKKKTKKKRGVIKDHLWVDGDRWNGKGGTKRKP